MQFSRNPLALATKQCETKERPIHIFGEDTPTKHTLPPAPPNIGFALSLSLVYERLKGWNLGIKNVNELPLARAAYIAFSNEFGEISTAELLSLSNYFRTSTPCDTATSKAVVAWLELGTAI